jgi:outer membrane protein W
MMKKTIILSLIILASFGTAFSQSIWSLSYEPATPLGDMRNFIDKSSLRGFSLSSNWFVTEKITVGFDVQWTAFYEKDERYTWPFDGGAVTATAWKEFYLWPLYATVKYHFLKDEEARLLPYAGLGIGVSYVEQSAQVGKYEFKEKGWKFAMAPEIGTLIPMGIEKTWGFNVKLRYQMAIYNKNDINLLQFLNYSFGVYWKIYKRGERY